jgi:predicted MFS family arabinose efflux permease
MAAAAIPSAWAPFRHRAFVVLWTAMLLSNVGGWMHDVGAGWLMTTLAPSPLLVALVQAATTLPVFVLALPAGALADIVDRRRLLLVAKAFMTLVALGLGLLVAAGGITPAALLLFTLAMGVGTAMVNPAWQSTVPQLVPRAELASAVALNSVGLNVSRALGPALGGVAIAALGLASPFFLNALSFLLVIAALLWWRPPPRPPRQLPAERWLGAMRAGVRYTRASRELKATLLRATTFLFFASAYWALLPLLARDLPGGGAELYGTLVTCIGAGAVGAAVLIPRWRRQLGASRLVVAASLVTAAVLITFAFARSVPLVAATAVVAGAAWITAVSSFNVSAQMSLPDWVRARGLAVFSAGFFGALALGSAVWGQTAALIGIPAALAAAGGGVLLAALATARVPLVAGGELDLMPSAHWPQPAGSSVEHERGPVMVSIQYCIEPQRAAEFLAVLGELGGARRRNGAYGWGVYRDAEQPGRYVEVFFEESWLGHLRHHERVTVADRDVQARVLALHRGAEPPLVEHLVAAEAVLAGVLVKEPP